MFCSLQTLLWRKKLIANVEQNLDHELDVPSPPKKNQD
jgi:hypothetical protein